MGDLLERNGVVWIVREQLAAALMTPPPPPLGVLTHATLLEAIHQHMDVLPVRYGIEMPDEEAIRDFLQQRRFDLSDDLIRLRGSGEIGLRIQLPPSPASAPAEDLPGAASPSVSVGQYLALRRRQYQRKDHLQAQTQRIAEQCAQGLSGLYRQQRRLASGRSDVLRLAFLVERCRWQACRERCGPLLEKLTGLQYNLLGPWPPYSFV
jgi:hypothetical protein